jgi:hypothetical protein
MEGTEWAAVRECFARVFRRADPYDLEAKYDQLFSHVDGFAGDTLLDRCGVSCSERRGLTR